MTDVIAGRFALSDPIARGGTGTVWRAYDRKLGRFCAAKVLRRRDAGDLLRFVREQSVRVAHPHVLTPYSWAAEDAHVVIASELAEGGSLSSLLREHGALAESTAALLLDQLLEALEHVHAAGLVHRDVKPANILLRATGSAVPHQMLADFGLAVGADDARLTQVGTVVGTPGYLAPEVLVGEVAIDVRQDLFAAGRVAVAVLSGVEPRDFGDVAVPASPGVLREVVTAMTQPDPARRPPTATDIRAVLRPVVRPGQALLRDGRPIALGHRLPPLSAQAEYEIVALPTGPIATSSGPSERPTIAGPPHPRQGETPALTVAKATAPTSRRAVVLTALGFAGALAVAVPSFLAAAHTSSDLPVRPTGVNVHAIGAACSWPQEGDVAESPLGVRVRCAESAAGYVWARS